MTYHKFKDEKLERVSEEENKELEEIEKKCRHRNWIFCANPNSEKEMCYKRKECEEAEPDVR